MKSVLNRGNYLLFLLLTHNSVIEFLIGYIRSKYLSQKTIFCHLILEGKN